MSGVPRRANEVTWRICLGIRLQVSRRSSRLKSLIEDSVRFPPIYSVQVLPYWTLEGVGRRANRWNGFSSCGVRRDPICTYGLA